jgi:hypothetical protein
VFIAAILPFSPSIAPIRFSIPGIVVFVIVSIAVSFLATLTSNEGLSPPSVPSPIPIAFSKRSSRESASIPSKAVSLVPALMPSKASKRPSASIPSSTPSLSS